LVAEQLYEASTVEQCTLGLSPTLYPPWSLAEAQNAAGGRFMIPVLAPSSLPNMLGEILSSATEDRSRSLGQTTRFVIDQEFIGQNFQLLEFRPGVTPQPFNLEDALSYYGKPVSEMRHSLISRGENDQEIHDNTQKYKLWEISKEIESVQKSMEYNAVSPFAGEYVARDCEALYERARREYKLGDIDVERQIAYGFLLRAAYAWPQHQDPFIGARLNAEGLVAENRAHLKRFKERGSKSAEARLIEDELLPKWEYFYKILGENERYLRGLIDYYPDNS